MSNLTSVDAMPADFRLQNNNFDLLRFLFAFIVFLVHAYVLSGAEPLSILSEVFSSEIAVKSFFVVSGFLIFMSYENSRSTRNYFIKRFKRIYPAYFFIIVGAAVMGGFLGTYPWQDYFSSSQTLRYVVANLFFLGFLHPDLPGMFEHNTFQAVNGALWTLKIEVMFYFLVPLAVMGFRKFGRFQILLILYCGSVIYSIGMGYLANKTGASFYLELQRQLPGQIAFFMAGAAAYYYLAHLVKYAHYLIGMALLAFVLHDWLPWIAIQPFALAIIVIYVACVIPSLGNFDKYGDFSYGIYIVHFPILQLVIAQGGFNKHPWQMLAMTGALVLVAAFLLWHLVEKPFLRKSSHYVLANRG